MATTRQIAANRRNSKLSTGPRTDSGRAIVAQNARKHGLLSKEVWTRAATGEQTASVSCICVCSGGARSHYVVHHHWARR